MDCPCPRFLQSPYPLWCRCLDWQRAGFPHGLHPSPPYRNCRTAITAKAAAPVWKTGCHVSSPHCLSLDFQN
ncbi:hypothetical protein BN174_680003 [Clostridioides difficile E15]|nr:hypothetical protein BN174_680003 [Clostridioides difficile E15]